MRAGGGQRLDARAGLVFDVDDSAFMVAELPAALFGGGLHGGDFGGFGASLENDRGVAHLLRCREVDLRVDAGSDALFGSVASGGKEGGDGQDGDELQHAKLLGWWGGWRAVRSI